MRTTLTRFEPFRGVSSLQDQINRLFSEAFDRSSGEANLTTKALGFGVGFAGSQQKPAPARGNTRNRRRFLPRAKARGFRARSW